MTIAKTITLTEEELKLVPTASPEYHYCKPCWGIMSDPITAASLMKGLAHGKLRQLGVVNPENATSFYYQGLLSKIKPRKS